MRVLKRLFDGFTQFIFVKQTFRDVVKEEIGMMCFHGSLQNVRDHKIGRLKNDNLC